MRRSRKSTGGAEVLLEGTVRCTVHLMAFYYLFTKITAVNYRDSLHKYTFRYIITLKLLYFIFFDYL